MADIITVNVLKAMAQAGTTRLKVTPDMVITPQARSWAHQTGIQLIGEHNEAEKPKERHQTVDATLRPTTAEARERGIVTVMGCDKVGIIAAVAGKLAELGVNILDISQTIFRGLFVMTMVIDLSQPRIPFPQLRDELTAVGERLEVQVVVQKETVFEYMHRI